MSNTENKPLFSSRLAMLLVASGSAVGLGNIWRFPYLVGEGGGAAFIIIYLLAVLIIGHPVMLAEFIVGTTARQNVVDAYSMQSRKWRPFGYNNVVATYCLLSFYFVVAGWTLKYVVSSFSGALTEFNTAAEYSAYFDGYVSDTWQPLLYTMIFILITHCVISMGVQRGIERFSKVMMPLLFVLLIVLAITSLSMPNSIEGLKYLFVPDFSKIDTRVVLNAMGQVFFSLSLGHGCLATYATYFRPEADLRKTAMQLSLIDTGVALLASVIILPAVFSVGIEPTSGPPLVFITLPGIFNTLPFSSLVSGIFFMLLFIAALTSTISMYEILVRYITERHNIKRTWAATVISLSVAFTALFASLSFGAMSQFRLFGMTIYDMLDKLTSNIMLPLGGILVSIYVGWLLERSVVNRALRYRTEGRDMMIELYIILLKYISPTTIFIIFLDGIGVLKMFK